MPNVLIMNPLKGKPKKAKTRKYKKNPVARARRVARRTARRVARRQARVAAAHATYRSNPMAHKKHRRKKYRKNPLSAKQIAAGFGGKLRRKTKYRANPIKHRRRKHYRKNPIRSKRYRRNPILPAGFLHATVIPAMQGAAGATGLKVIMGQVSKFMPGFVGNPWIMTAVKLGVAAGMGVAAEKVTTRAVGRTVTQGAMIGAFDNLFSMLLGQFVPGVPLGEWAGIAPGLSLEQWDPYDAEGIENRVDRRQLVRETFWGNNPALATQVQARHPHWVNPATEPKPFNSAAI